MYKHDRVVCLRLTGKGRVVVECLKRMYEALGLRPALPAAGSGES